MAERRAALFGGKGSEANSNDLFIVELSKDAVVSVDRPYHVTCFLNPVFF